MPYKKSDLELLSQLRDQILLLESSINLFDKGIEIEAKRMATCLRILLHDTSQSKSLFFLLDIKGKFKYYNTSSISNEFSHTGLVSIRCNEDWTVSIIPNKKDLQELEYKRTSFVDWWNCSIYKSFGTGKSFSRKDVILALANKDGGAHIDENLEHNYAVLSRQKDNFKFFDPSGKRCKIINNFEDALMRQIAEEFIKMYHDQEASILEIKSKKLIPTPKSR